MVRIEFERKVGPKGQVVIPKEIRRIVGIRPESKVYISLEGERIIIRTRKEGSVDEFLKIIPEERRKRITIEDIKKHYEEEMEERWRGKRSI
ncbi:MAG: AbrB/MazE/SpoVT family DNA-binding domain-containing protein [Nitrososphaeria archaeon]